MKLFTHLNQKSSNRHDLAEAAGIFIPPYAMNNHQIVDRDLFVAFCERLQSCTWVDSIRELLRASRGFPFEVDQSINKAEITAVGPAKISFMGVTVQGEGLADATLKLAETILGYAGIHSDGFGSQISDNPLLEQSESRWVSRMRLANRDANRVAVAITNALCELAANQANWAQLINEPSAEFVIEMSTASAGKHFSRIAVEASLAPTEVILFINGHAHSSSIPASTRHAGSCTSEPSSIGHSWYSLERLLANHLRRKELRKEKKGLGLDFAALAGVPVDGAPKLTLKMSDLLQVIPQSCVEALPRIGVIMNVFSANKNKEANEIRAYKLDSNGRAGNIAGVVASRMYQEDARLPDLLDVVDSRVASIVRVLLYRTAQKESLLMEALHSSSLDSLISEANCKFIFEDAIISSYLGWQEAMKNNRVATEYLYNIPRELESAADVEEMCMSPVSSAGVSSVL